MAENASVAWFANLPAAPTPEKVPPPPPPQGVQAPQEPIPQEPIPPAQTLTQHGREQVAANALGEHYLPETLVGAPVPQVDPSEIYQEGGNVKLRPTIPKGGEGNVERLSEIATEYELDMGNPDDVERLQRLAAFEQVTNIPVSPETTPPDIVDMVMRSRMAGSPIQLPGGYQAMAPWRDSPSQTNPYGETVETDVRTFSEVPTATSPPEVHADFMSRLNIAPPEEITNIPVQLQSIDEQIKALQEQRRTLEAQQKQRHISIR